MGTRAVITVTDEYNSFSIYQHYDGYPAGMVHTLVNAIPMSWGMDRFEAMDFAAAIIAGNKTGGGNYYLTSGPDAHGDLEYTYEVTKARNGQFIIRANHISYNEETKEFFYGRLKDFVDLNGEDEAKALWNKLDKSSNKLTA